MKIKINEIFDSIQGEGPVVGCRQLFVRFCGCNLNCAYCDTEFNEGIEYTPDELFRKITLDYNLNVFHSVSLTGGEPLLSAEFLKEFLPLVQKDVKIYLETNAVLFDKIAEIKEYIDIISADIKLKSSSGFDSFALHEKFFENCSGIETFAKIVFDENITEDEIEKCVRLAGKYNLELILQPKMSGDKMTVSSAFCTMLLNKFTEKYKNTRLIPQVHKFLDVR